MDLNFTPAELAFRDEVRAFLREQLPADISDRDQERPGDQGAGLHALAEDPARARLGRAGLAETVRRSRLGSGRDAHLRRGSRSRRRAAPDSVRPEDGCARHHGVRHAGAAAALPAAHRERRRLVVPGLLRTGRRLRPRLAQDARRTTRRSLRRERPEDLEHARPIRRLDLLPGAHRSECAEAAAGHFVPADRHEIARHHRAPDHHDGRRARSERSVARERESAGRESRRRGEQGLDLRQVPARSRAHQHRRRRRFQARVAAPQGDRAQRNQERPSADRGSAVRGAHRPGRDRSDGARDHQPARAVGRIRETRDRARKHRSSRSRAPRSSRRSAS